jgi:hypothetical protein
MTNMTDVLHEEKYDVQGYSEKKKKSRGVCYHKIRNMKDKFLSLINTCDSQLINAQDKNLNDFMESD